MTAEQRRLYTYTPIPSLPAGVYISKEDTMATKSATEKNICEASTDERDLSRKLKGISLDPTQRPFSECQAQRVGPETAPVHHSVTTDKVNVGPSNPDHSETVWTEGRQPKRDEEGNRRRKHGWRQTHGDHRQQRAQEA